MWEHIYRLLYMLSVEHNVVHAHYMAKISKSTSYKYNIHVHHAIMERVDKMALCTRTALYAYIHAADHIYTFIHQSLLLPTCTYSTVPGHIQTGQIALACGASEFRVRVCNINKVRPHALQLLFYYNNNNKGWTAYSTNTKYMYVNLQQRNGSQRFFKQPQWLRIN